MNAEDLFVHRGSCHCGAVRFTLRAPMSLTVNQCNCSVCARSGYLSMIVEPGRFELLQGQNMLQEYRFNTGHARHQFCRICGIKAFYIPRSHPHCVSVNARCLEPDGIESMTIRKFDGRNWDEYYTDDLLNPLPE